MIRWHAAAFAYAVVSLGLGILTAPRVVEAQRSETVARIGLLNAHVLPAGAEATWRPFLQALRELGWVEGRNRALEWRYAEGQLERLPELAADLVRLRVDVIVSGTPPALMAAKRATATIGHLIFRGRYYDSRTGQSLAGDEALTPIGQAVVDHWENGFGEGRYAGYAFSVGAQLIRDGDGPLRGEGRGQID